MAKLDFPSSPSFGQTYPSPPVAGVPVYTWDLEKWVASGPVGSPPQAPFDAMAYSGMQINGGMEVSQENGTTSITTVPGSRLFVVDGVSIFTTAGIVISAAQVTDAPLGYSNSVKFSVTTAKASLAATDEIDIVIPIEGYRTSRLAFGSASAQPVTIGFWSKIHRTGLYSGSVSNNDYNRCYPFTFTQNVADTWEYKTVTVSGDTTGTWERANGGGINIQFLIAGGSTVLRTAGAWGSVYAAGATGSTNGVAATSDTFQITGLTVLPGTQAPTAAQSPNIMRPYGDELVTCKRYLRIITPEGSGITNAVGSSWFVVRHDGMRTAPTVTAMNALAITDIITTNWTQTAPHALISSNTSEAGLYIFANFTIAPTTNGGHVIFQQDLSPNKVKFDARL